jgi:adenine phosphoribosyltransferase
MDGGMPELTDLAAAIRDVADFPEPGIVFKDITPLLADPALFSLALDLLCDLVANQPIDKVVGIDARGFIFAGAVADRLGAGFVPIRKKGKLPWLTHGSAYSLEYGQATVEVHQDAISAGENVLLVDDLLATGGTAAAALKILETLGARVVAATFLIELGFLNGRHTLQGQRVESILRF